MKSFNIKEYESRIHKLQNFLKIKNITLAVLTQTTDIYYYTGSVQPLYLIIPAKGKGLILLRKALKRAQKEIKHLKSEIFNNTSELETKLSNFNKKITAFTLDTISYATVDLWKNKFKINNIVDISWDIRLLRTVKSEKEIQIMKKAGLIVNNIPKIIRETFKHNMTELELSAEIEKYLRLKENSIIMKCRRLGVECTGLCSSGINTLEGTKFDGISAGKGLSSAFPYGASKDKIKSGIPCLIDFGYNYNGYHIDQTRMFSYKKPEEKVLKAYSAMVQIEKLLLKKIKPGVKWYEVYEYSVQLAKEMGWKKEFMGLNKEKVKFVGHGVGLELDEPPFLAPKMDYSLEKGNVLAIEPKVSLQNIGVIGIEDTFVITENGTELITNAPRKFMILT